MKLYHTVVELADLGTTYRWHTSKREAWRDGNRYAREEGDEAGLQSWRVEMVEIKPTRNGLVAWLNVNPAPGDPAA